MYGNGLLEYYKKAYFRDGFLDISKLRMTEDGKQSAFDTCISCKSPVGAFYKKYHNYFSKEMADAEILLSQLYNKLGLTSAVYLPAQERGHKFLLSNSVDGKNVFSATIFNSYVTSQVGCDQKQVCNLMNKQVCSSSEGKQIVEYFSDRVLAQKIKMRVLDCAANNPDREDCNYVFKVDENNVAQDILVFDHERSGLEAYRNMMQGGNGKFTTGYCNDFGLKNASREDVIDQIKHSEMCNELVDNHALAEQIGSVDVNAVALDICRTTGYMIEPKYTDYISKSFNITANYLDK